MHKNYISLFTEQNCISYDLLYLIPYSHMSIDNHMIGGIPYTALGAQIPPPLIF